MKTKVIFLKANEDNEKDPLWREHDYGYIDGYVCDQYGKTFAIVVVNNKIVKCPLDILKPNGHLVVQTV